MNRALPRLLCPRRTFGGLEADLSSAPWRDVGAVPLRDAVSGGIPNQGTEVRTAWDGSEWRVLFHCSDADAWATLTERDAPLYEEETVEVFFDPVGDLEGYFEIEVNPLGAVLDLVFRRSRSGYKGDRGWDCDGLRTHVRRGEQTWTAEFAVPFASVATAPPTPGTEWRVNFCRIDRPSRDGSLPRELSAWSPPGRANFHTQERFGTIVFSDQGADVT